MAPEEVSFLAEGKKLVEGVPAGTRDRFSGAGSAEGKTSYTAWRRCFDIVPQVLVEGLLWAGHCQETQASREGLQRKEKRSQDSASIQTLFPSHRGDCVFITQGGYLIQDPQGQFSFSLFNQNI